MNNCSQDFTFILYKLQHKLIHPKNESGCQFTEKNQHVTKGPVAEPFHPTILARRASIGKHPESLQASTNSSWPSQIELKVEPTFNKDFLISSNFNCGMQKICPKHRKSFEMSLMLSGELESWPWLNMPKHGRKRAKN